MTEKIKRPRGPHFRTLVVTSDLALSIKQTRPWSRRSGVYKGREQNGKSFVVMNLTSNPEALKILQPIFAKPRASQAFQR